MIGLLCQFVLDLCQRMHNVTCKCTCIVTHEPIRAHFLQMPIFRLSIEKLPLLNLNKCSSEHLASRCGCRYHLLHRHVYSDGRQIEHTASV